VPLYEYQCKQCGHRFEKIQSFSAPEEKECPECKGPVERLLSAPAIQFKGSGWYVNDYAGRGKAPSAKTSDGGSKDGTAKDGKIEGAKNDSSKSDSGAAASNSGSSAASTSGSGSTAKSSD
jgi:putative FmdB family regulatory protein